MKLSLVFTFCTWMLTFAIAHAQPSLLPSGPAPDPGAAPNVEQVRTQNSNVENCWITVSQKYNIPTYLLFAIGMVESGLNPTAVNINRNGSKDFGYMQINDWWYPRLRKFGIMPHHLADPCVSIHVGAWVLAQNFHQMGYTWQAIGAYNARDPVKRWKYAQRVYAMHDMLVKWSDAYYGAYKKHHGKTPAFVPKPPNAWVRYARQNAAHVIKAGMPPR